MSARLAAMARGDPAPGRKRHYLNVIDAGGRWNHRVEIVPEALGDPLAWAKPSLIFVNSMSDLFHESVAVHVIGKVFEIMNRADWHIYQILTKRSARLAELSPKLPWSRHIWQGVSVENRAYRCRIDDVRNCGAAVTFLSLEPLLGPLTGLDLRRIDWVIVGGESGPGARPMDPAWVRDLRSMCGSADPVLL
jgi:protein gp37